ncbi:Hypothetical protein POVR1_LOCUS26 [uncultured virus]|nr:Hypothetical protein POVR1_LOCUS26 [uncultured virus]
MTLLEALLGIPNVSRCDLSSLSDGELPIEIIKSRLILASVSSEALVRGANLKMLVGGDPIFVENDVIQVWRKIFITTNSRLQFEDNPGLRHRIVVIPMNAHFVDSVPFLLRKLKNQLTMSAFLNWLLIGADRARNQFKSLPEVVESATNQYFEMGG